MNGLNMSKEEYGEMENDPLDPLFRTKMEMFRL